MKEKREKGTCPRCGTDSYINEDCPCERDIFPFDEPEKEKVALKPYYENENGKLYHGNCLEIMPMLDKVDLVLTDPPYGINNSSVKGDYIGGNFIDNEEYIINTVVNKILPLCFNVSPTTIITCGIKNMWNYPKPDSFGVIYYPAAVSWQKHGSADTNPILYYGKSKKKGPLSFKCVSTAPKTGHPCTKPTEQWLLLTNRFAKKGETILDPFFGSGTTGIVCGELKINWVGIEIEEKYCEIAAKRIEAENRQLKLF